MANITFKQGLIFLSFMIFSFHSFSQKNKKIKNFSNDFELFVSEFESFMISSKDNEQRAIYKSFIKSSKSFSQEDKSKIISISNKMLDKRLKSRPHFNSFINSLIVVNLHNRREVLLPQWLDVIDTILQVSTTSKFTVFCDFTIQLISSNTLRDSKSVKWVVNSDKYHFIFNPKGPAIYFSKEIDLSCFSKDRQINILSTQGTYYPIINEWIGEKGTINWADYFPKDSVFAFVSNYIVDTRQSVVVADSSVLYNKYLFNKGITGKLVNKIVLGKNSDKYPLFTSYSNNIELKEIFPNIDYRGGYKLSGKEFIADGGKSAKARIVFKKADKDIFIANSSRFTISSDEITSKESGVKIFFDNDSIYHSNLKFKYSNNNRELQLYRDADGLSGAKMLNTYHQLTMDFELFKWDIDSDSITFGSIPGTGESRLTFESVSMYDSTRFDELRGIDKVHPLMLIKRYAKASKKNVFHVNDFARFTGFPTYQIKPYLIRIASQGFIYYNSIEDKVTIQPMLYNYIKAASGIGDYDVISFPSHVKGSRNEPIVNAVLDISTKELTILGINDVLLSHKRKVWVIPNNQQIIVNQNRDFTFDGYIILGDGRMQLDVRNTSFYYDKFKLDLNNIESLALAVPTNPRRKDQNNLDILTRVKTVLNFVKDPTLPLQGEICIDDPSNKSGVRSDSFPQFPTFESFERSYAYYNKKTTYNGVYNKTDFFFHLEPFKIDTLNNFSRKGLNFAGTFSSSGIFPVITDTLRLQDDNSLGFNITTPKDGFDIYGGKAKYYDKLHLSDLGLMGSGKFKYLNATASSDEILFFPDSTNLHTNEFMISEVVSGIEFPEVSNTATYARYLPYKDLLMINKKKKDFNFYKSQATFSGDLIMKPTGLTGKGIMKLDKAEVTADLFKYNANWFKSDTASLDVFEDGGLIAFRAKNLRTYIDLEIRQGIFNSNGFGSYVELPANQYICYIDELKWSMDKELLTLGEQFNQGGGSEFISVHPRQDSLRFFAKTARYSLKDYIIHAGGVEELFIADAIIEPDSGLLTVAKKGIIQTLNSAKIVANDSTKYHVFTNASIDIKSANQYLANGYYTYKDATNNSQEIFFNDIRVNSDLSTIAKAELENEALFHIDSKFDFKGSIELISDRKDLTFDGFFMINHDCNLIKKEWVKFRSEINPKDIVFMLDKKVYNEKDNLLSTSLVMNVDSNNIYSTFLSKKKKKNHIDMLSASHSLKYDNKNNAYIVGGPDSLDNYYIFYDKECRIEAVGKIDLGVDLGRVNVSKLGKISHEIKSQKTEIEGLLMLDFFFSEEAMNQMHVDIQGEEDENHEYNKDILKRNLDILLGKQNSSTIFLDLMEYGEYEETPSKMNKTLVFLNNKFLWDNKNKAYVFKGDIWIGNIYSQVLGDVSLQAYIVMKKGARSDKMSIYLTDNFEYSTDIKYYFNYERNKMRVWSVNTDFIDEINKIKEGKRSLKSRKGAKSYSYMVGKEADMKKFVKIVKEKY